MSQASTLERQQRYTYDVYGLPGQAEDGQPFRYTGRRYDAETGLYYYRARYYSPKLGRFLQTDPIGYEDNMNLYGYVANDPVNGVDPQGTDAGNSCLAMGTCPQPTNAEALEGAGVIADFIPVVGDIKGAVEFFDNPTALGGVAVVAGLVPIVGDVAGKFLKRADNVANAVPETLARVTPGDANFPTLGSPGNDDVFVTAAEDIAGMNASQIAERLAIPPSDTFTVTTFPSSSVDGIATPINRNNLGFIQGGRTAGGAREFVIPNGPVPAGALRQVCTVSVPFRC